MARTTLVPVLFAATDLSMKPLHGHAAAEHSAENDPEHGVNVVHEESGVVVVLKPSGIATQAPPGIDSMECRMRKWLDRRGGGYLGVPHRLDRPVSGVMLFAVTPRAARQLSRQFERRQIVKWYSARLELLAPRGIPGGEWAEWRDRIAKIPNEPRGRIVPPDEPCAESQEAVTQVRLSDAARPHGGGDRNVIEVDLLPLTGRMHQLRIQAASRGMPVLGDALYGSTRPFQEDRNQTIPYQTTPDQTTQTGSFVSPIALHASRIEYLDPDTRTRVVVNRPPTW